MNQQDAARAVLIEVVNVLGAFRDEIVIVGGWWVPDLTFPGKNHVGSPDVDLAVSPHALGSDAYSTILGRLQEKNYSHSTSPTRFLRSVPGASEPVKVDLISGEYAQGERTKTITVNELQLNTLRGIDLAFECCDGISISGTMPDGIFNTVRARIVRPEAFILIKAFALDERVKAKDAYDVAFVLSNYQPTLAALAERVAPLATTGLGAEAFTILCDKFAALDAVGPQSAANVAAENGQDRGQALQAAFQDAQELFSEVERFLSAT
ncbi:MAG: hypothetical protein ACI8P0_001302 [Planctomycetaceae bacterium]|jgi:hypothetical protein